MREYKSSGAAPLPGILIALALGGLASIIMGGVLYAIEHYLHFYLILIFPGVAAFVAGLVLSAGVKAGKLRNAAIAALLGVVCSVLLIGTYHFAKYQLELKDLAREQISTPDKPASNAEVEQAVDEYLTGETGQKGFLGYLNLEAKQGISITRAGSSSRGLELTGIGFWIYSGVEFLIVLFLVTVTASSAAGEPFDENVNEWFGDEAVALTAPVSSANPMVAALKAGQFQEAGKHLQTQEAPMPRLEFSVRRTAKNDPRNVYVEVKAVNQDGKNTKRVDVASGLISEAELQQVMANAVPNLEPTEASAPAAM